MKKRLISFLLAVTVVATGAEGALPVTAVAGEALLEEELPTEGSEDPMDAELLEELIVEETESGSEGQSGADDSANECASEAASEDLVVPEEILVEENSSEEEVLVEELLPEEDTGETKEGRSPRSTGFKELPKDIDIQSPKSSASFDAAFAEELEELEPYYITPNLPDLRDQGWYGTCWAFSSLALAEINMMNNGTLPDQYQPEYSKLHLAYFSYNSVTDPLGGTEGDRNGCYTEGGSLLDVGGNLLLSENVLSNWVGAADESVLPYSYAGEIDTTVVDEGLAYSDMAHLQNYYVQVYDRSDLSPVKKLIKDCGAVGISFFAIDPYGGYSSQNVYNFATNAYYNPDCYMANHAVAIVGWDDNFSRNNFVETPEGDGAWLVRNSWGEGDLENSMDFDGYFWLSYYDQGIYDYVNAFEFEPADNYDNNYQYDGGMDLDDVVGQKAANVFTSKAPGGAAGETLEAVGFYVGYGNTSYEVSVYTDLTEEHYPDGKAKAANTVKELKPAAKVSGICNYSGYHTVKLPEEVDLPEGTVFSVVVELNEYDENGKAHDSGHFGYECSGNYWYTVMTSARPGESFLYNDSEWMDFGESFNANLKIKAYTKDKETDDPENAPYFISFEQELDENGIMDIIVSESKHLTPQILPENASNKKILYTSDNTEVATVRGGVLYGVSEGTAVITATAKQPALDGKNATTSFTVRVTPKLRGVTIKGEYTLEIGQTCEYILSSIPKGIDIGTDVYWFTSNSKVVKINEYTGVAKAQDVGFAQITAITDDYANTIGVWVYPQSPPEFTGTVDRYNNVTLTWKPSQKASYYKVYRDGRELKKITNSSGKTEYKYTDTKYRDNFESKTPTYRVYAYRKDYCSYSEVRLSTNARIYFDPNGGTVSSKYMNFTPGEEDAELPVPVKKGYSFRGWFDENENLITGLSDIEKEELSEGKYTLYAEYDPISYSVRFDKNSDLATGEMPDQSLVYDTSAYLYKAAFERGKDLESGKIYSFKGWNTRPDGAGTSFDDGAVIENLTDIPGEVITLYAQWEVVKYTVTFDTAGGSYVKPVTVLAGESINKPVTDPVMKGYDFAGWYTDSTYERLVTFPMEVTENTILIAGWKGEPVAMTITDAADPNRTYGILCRNTEDGEPGFDVTLSAKVLLKDGNFDPEKEMIWKTTDPMVAGFSANKYATILTDTKTTVGKESESVVVSIYSGEDPYDYTDFPAAGRTAYIYAICAEDPSVYASYKVVIVELGSTGDGPSVENDLIILDGSDEDKIYGSAMGKRDDLTKAPDVAIGSPLQLSAAFDGSSDSPRIYWSSDNMAVATVSSDGKVTGKSGGLVVITAKDLDSGISASVKLKVIEKATSLSFDKTNIKVGKGNEFILKIASIAPSELADEISFSSNKESVARLVDMGFDDAGEPIAVFLAVGTGKAIITAKAPGGKTTKCNVTVGKAVTSLSLKKGIKKVAAGKSLKLTATFNNGNKKDQPLNKSLRWFVTDLEGNATDLATIDSKTGKLTGLKPGTVKVFAESTTDSDGEGEVVRTPDNDAAIVRVYVPLKKASFNATNVTLKPGAEYEISLKLTPTVSDLPVTAGFDEYGRAVDILSTVSWEYNKSSDKKYIRIEKAEGGSCTIYTLQATKNPVKVKASYKTYGGKKKTITCNVTVNDKLVNKITLSSSSLSMGRGAVKEISAILNPTVPKEAGVIWTIDEKYAEDICFVESDGVTESSELSVTTDMQNGGKNKVRIKSKNTSITTPKTVKLTAKTVGKNVSGKNLKATCTIKLFGDVNYIALSSDGQDVTEQETELEVKKTLKLEAVAYFKDEETLTKSGSQSFNFESSDETVAKVTKTTGKVTAVSPGTAVITVKTTDGSEITNSCLINVFAPVTALTLDRKGLTIGLKGNSRYNIITPAITPDEAFDLEGGELTWTFDRPEMIAVCAVDNDLFIGGRDIIGRQRILSGMDQSAGFASADSITTYKGQSLAVKALQKGSLTATVTAPSGLSATCTIDIYAHVKGLDVIGDFGASPGDDYDDNAAFNKAIKAAYNNAKTGKGETTVYVPAGEYQIAPFDIVNGSDETTTGIHLLDNVSLVMDENAILRVESTAMADYGVICVRGGKEERGAGPAINMNVTIDGGQIKGERSVHEASYGEGGFGIYLAGAANVTISNMKIYDNWGDGIYIGTRAWFDTKVGCRNITIRNCDIYNNRRNNISIVDMGYDKPTGKAADENVKVFTKGLLVENCNLKDAHGHDPQCGIYVEPNLPTNSHVWSEFRPCLKLYFKNTKITAYQKKDDLAYCCFMTHWDPANNKYSTADDITFDKCTITGAFGNFSGWHLKLINGTKITGTIRNCDASN